MSYGTMYVLMSTDPVNSGVCHPLTAAAVINIILDVKVSGLLSLEDWRRKFKTVNSSSDLRSLDDGNKRLRTF